MFILLSIVGFAAVIGLFTAANLEERKLLPSVQHIQQHPTDLEPALPAEQANEH